MSIEGRNEALERWATNRAIADKTAELRQERSYLLGVASGELPIPPAENGPGAIVGLWERLDAIDVELSQLAANHA